MFKTLNDIEIKNKKVIVRCDYNVPLENGKITDDSRIRKTLPTINYLLENGVDQIILCSHLGKPKGEFVPKFSLTPVYERLKELVDEKVTFLPEKIMEIKTLPESKIVLLENTRFDKREKTNGPEYGKKLAGFADVFVIDAFGAAHRAHASVVGIADYIPACAGKLMEKEVNVLKKVSENPEKPYNSIIGGAKADKINVIKKLLPKVEKIIIGGILANTFLKANGIDVRGSKYDSESVDVAKELLANNKNKIVLPVDAVVAETFDKDANFKTTDLDTIPEGWLILDIGPKSIEKYKKVLKDSTTITWGGPIGVFEWENFATGTKEIAKYIADLNCKSVICGGDSGAAVTKFGLEEDMFHVSTGGGASLTMLAGKKLDAIEALEKNAKKFP